MLKIIFKPINLSLGACGYLWDLWVFVGSCGLLWEVVADCGEIFHVALYLN